MSHYNGTAYAYPASDNRVRVQIEANNVRAEVYISADSAAELRNVLGGIVTGKDANTLFRVAFDCGHMATIWKYEFGDGSAWCQACGEFQCYEADAVAQVPA